MHILLGLAHSLLLRGEVVQFWRCGCYSSGSAVNLLQRYKGPPRNKNTHGYKALANARRGLCPKTKHREPKIWYRTGRPPRLYVLGPTTLSTQTKTFSIGLEWLFPEALRTMRCSCDSCGIFSLCPILKNPSFISSTCYGTLHVAHFTLVQVSTYSHLATVSYVKQLIEIDCFCQGLSTTNGRLTPDRTTNYHEWNSERKHTNWDTELG